MKHKFKDRGKILQVYENIILIKALENSMKKYVTYRIDMWLHSLKEWQYTNLKSNVSLLVLIYLKNNRNQYIFFISIGKTAILFAGILSKWFV